MPRDVSVQNNADELPDRNNGCSATALTRPSPAPTSRMEWKSRGAETSANRVRICSAVMRCIELLPNMA
eukprot:CAMPEP_0204595752 /NCGR_PEP_ID=MMETSP0661-20131031/52856_1 /ASSEMBLY_ACC=CAM_ASM_000606 /TAXON_ID=109239 /ORGANISM="Alexandrium margalefi, Strain AMGDE01CS-322" /LENGTH=68 /DNA_ID=CAMNT_0051606311 /DNA_START=473 /DNA_END=679 /DNA_ORIENTATION=-